MADKIPIPDPMRPAREMDEAITAPRRLAEQIAKGVKPPESIAEAIKAAITPKMPAASYPFPNIPVATALRSIRGPSTEERHEYESAATFLTEWASRLRTWRAELPEDAQPIILAILPRGASINVMGFAADGHNGVRIKGMLGETECMYLVHQNSLQLLCYIEKMEKGAPKPRKIGFRIGDQEVEA